MKGRRKRRKRCSKIGLRESGIKLKEKRRWMKRRESKRSELFDKGRR